MSKMTFVDELIRDGQSALYSLPKFHDTILMMNKDEDEHIFRIPIHDIFLKYRTHFEETVSLYQVPRAYYYKPKFVSLELYNTTEMWLSLLRLNCMRNVSEFNLSMIKIYDPDAIFELINIFFKRENKMS